MVLHSPELKGVEKRLGKVGPFKTKLQFICYNEENSFYLVVLHWLLFCFFSPIFAKLAVFLLLGFLTHSCRFRGVFCVPLASPNLAQQFGVAERFIEDGSAEMWLLFSKAEGTA